MSSSSIGRFAKAALSARPWPAWPWSAFVVWAAAWAICLWLVRLQAPSALAVAVGCALGLICGLSAPTRHRAIVIAGGFPLSLAIGSMGAAWPAWAWLPPLALLWLLYPRTAWRDAPWFPTPTHALVGLSAKVELPPGARVLDAGCGAGHGLWALHRAYPRARLDGIEWGGALALAARWRCRFAAVRRGDMWAHDWSPYRLVYLFQRPESMPRALAKAQSEMAPGSWLASLEFEAEGWRSQAVVSCPDGRSVWLYRLPLRAAHPQVKPGRADK